VHPLDLEDPTGKAEAYYVLKRWKKRFHLFRFPPLPEIISIKRVPNFLAFNLWALFHLRRFVRHAPYDLVYAYKSALLVPLIMKKIFRTPLVYDLQTHPVRQEPPLSGGFSLRGMVQSIYHRFKEILYRRALRDCDLVITVSPTLKDEFINQFSLPPQKVHVMPLGVDLRLFSRQKRPPHSPPAPMKIVYVSSLALYRGHKTCIEATRILKEKGVRFRMEFIGSGDSSTKRKLTQEIKLNGVVGDVILRGGLPHHVLPSELEEAHVGLSPLPDLEAYRVSSPTKVFEYMAMGLPIVASDIEAHRRILTEGKTALFFRPDDPNDLAARLLDLYLNPNLRERLGEEAQRDARHYDWDLLLSNLEDRIFGLLQSTSPDE
jgi:glycosyltransferase involved in cell wall biosynthesis